MRLKDYQREALERVEAFAKAVAAANDELAAAEQALAALAPDMRAKLLQGQEAPSVTAWKAMQAMDARVSPNAWVSLLDGWGRDIPHVCLEMPTGSGKTLVAGHAVGRINAALGRRRTGLVLWIVPSDAIYRQTLGLLRDRGSGVRIALETASGGAVKILQKGDGFTAADVETQLCVMILMLQSTGRKDKETLKVFRDSGAYGSFFPQVDDVAALTGLKAAVPNLDGYDVADGVPPAVVASGIKYSLGNVLRVVRPIIILDEGHRAYSVTARATLAGMNPRFLMELTATPDRAHSNILVNVNGRTLADQQMVKLPIELFADAKSSWQDTLAASVERLRKVQARADVWNVAVAEGRHIRPILLVRVERTGKDQRDGVHIHTEDAFEELTQRLGVPAEWIRRQTATDKELKNDDLMAEDCQVRVIITKDALREGWDCPFAYILALLPKGQAPTALTQMIGRVMRMPHVTYTGDTMLDRAHVFCNDLDVKEAVARIKKGLEEEGMGDIAGSAVSANGDAEAERIVIARRAAFRDTRVMVPRVTHRDGAGRWRELDYDADILSAIDWRALRYDGADALPLTGQGAERVAAVIDVAQGDAFDMERVGGVDRGAVAQRIDMPDLARRLLALVPNAWLAMDLVKDAVAKLVNRAGGDEAVVANIRLNLIGDMRERLGASIQERAKAVFDAKVQAGDIQFRLRGVPFERLNWEAASSYAVDWRSGDKWLRDRHDNEAGRTLFEKVLDRDLNGFERDVALYADGSDAIGWWWRLVQRRDWGLQGWRRHKVYPDFLVRLDGEGGRLLALETKGKQLDNADTKFKRELFELLEAAYTTGRDVGEMELIDDAPTALRFRILMQDEAWQPEMEKAIG
jgi:type III restriction enzyme